MRETKRRKYKIQKIEKVANIYIYIYKNMKNV